MPPEPLPWDRKDLFKERKHERLASESVGPVSRWRDAPHHGLSRWCSSDFRRPPGNGKQGAWHLFSEESGHGFTRSWSSEKILEDESCRQFGSCGDGKYSRYNRENRGYFIQKDWKGHSLENAALPNGPGRPSDLNAQRSVDNMLMCNSHPPHSDDVHSRDQQKLKGKHAKSGGGDGLGTGQRFGRENSLVSIDWKPLKWTRSGSLSSRGSGFSHSSSSKSIGSDPNEMKAEVQLRNVTPVQSPSGDAAACVTSAAPLEETSSRKKPRLGWGEGLAKYEKKKVEGPDDVVAKNAMVICGRNSEHVLSYAAKSPRITVFQDCASPATASSFACSSSPGLEEKPFVKAANVDNDTSTLSGSPALISQNHSEGFTFNLENLDLSPITNFSSSVSELLQSLDPNFMDSVFFRSSASNKLLVWKGDILKALEKTESEIDLLDNELTSLISEPESSCPYPAASSSLPVGYLPKPCEELGAPSSSILRPASLQLVSSGDMIIERQLNAQEEEHAEVKDEDIDSPGTATSKFVEPLSLGKAVSPSDAEKDGECFGNLDTYTSGNMEVKYSICGLNEKTHVVSACEDSSQLIGSNKCAPVSTDSSSYCDHREDNLYDSVLSSNKDSANRAFEVLSSNKDSAKRASDVFNKLLPTNQCHIDFSKAAGVSYLQNDFMIKEKFEMRKRFIRFKERILMLKYRAFHHLWKEDMHLLSMRKYRVKSQKKSDISLRTMHSLHQKNRSSICSRFSSLAGNLSLVPTTEIINFTSKMLLDSQVKLCRNNLKMPSLNLDKKEKMISRFISSNGLVEDPSAVEKERSMINPWTSEEKEVFIDKLATFGKDFRKIASFLDHKTTADCIEFYYKNHKSDCFEKTKKKPEFAKEGKSYSTNTYLVTSGKRWNREANAAALDMLGAASAVAVNVDDGMEIQQKCISRYYNGMSSNYKTPRGGSGFLESSSGLDIFNNDRETVAADVLAGICGSLSSEAMSSIDPRVCYQEWKCQKLSSSMRRPLTPEITQNIDDETCSDESCGEMYPADWTDEEKSIFVQAVSSYGKDFTMISRCVRTRSTDQCKVFFSKARICLGLDMIIPGIGNGGTPMTDEANGGGSDTEDACIVDTASVVCGKNLSFKIDEDTWFSNLKVKHNETDLAGTTSLHPDLNRSEENIKTGEPDCENTDIRSENLGPVGCQVEDKPELDGDNTGYGVMAVQVQKSIVKPSDSGGKRDEAIGQDCLEASVSAVEVYHHGLHSKSGDEAETRAVGVVSAEHSRAEMEEQELVVPLNTLYDERVENSVTNTSGMCISNCSLRGSDPMLQSAGNASHLAADTNSFGFGVDSGYQHVTAMELDSTQELKVIPLQQDNCVVTINSVTQDSAAIQYEKTVNDDIPPTFDLGKIGDAQYKQSANSDDNSQHQSECSLLDHVESSQIFRGYPMPVSAMEMNGDISCEKPVSLQSISKLDRNFHSGRFLAQNRYLQKCDSSKHHSLEAELPFLSQEQTRDHPRPPSQSSSDVEKPYRNGDFKLFGQILTHPSSQPNSDSTAQGNDVKRAQHPKLNDKRFNLSAQSKFDHNNYLGLENLPTRNCGFWDGNRIQTGFPSLPDSAILLAKYPAAFGNYLTPSSKMEQQQPPPHAVVNRKDHTPNGVSVFPTREISCSNGVADCQMYRSRDGNKGQPFTVDVMQRQEILFSEMQRRNDFDAVSSIQQAKGLVGINVVGRGGILVGGSCSGVSDPVAAIRMHYAKAEQTVREEDSWRGKGDLGRL